MPRPLWLFVFGNLVLLPSLLRADIDKRIQVEARGPVHEAFAQPYTRQPAPNQAIDQEPPAPITEEPPDDRPTGNNVQWIPGYWQYDDEKKDFVWISGFWRDVPTGRRWVGGFWAKTADGHRWVSGHWAADQERDYQLVQPPPRNLDEGPSTPAPDADSFYIPGSWFYLDDGYKWRPGYWAGCRTGQLWVPARYFWTPSGWAFSSGYWDYPLAGRGVLFAPVSFAASFGFGPGFVYRPNYVVSLGLVSSSFFVRASASHYYFGDYYSRGYLSTGIQPWFTYGARNYDPIFAYDRWANRSNPDWHANLRSAYDGRGSGTLATPPRTLADSARTGPRMANATTALTPLRESGLPLEKLSSTQRAHQIQNAQQMTRRSTDLARAPTQNSIATFTRPTTAMGSNTTVRPVATSSPGISGLTTSFKPSYLGSGNPGSNTTFAGSLSRPGTSIPAPRQSIAVGRTPNFGSTTRSTPSITPPNFGRPSASGGSWGGRGFGSVGGSFGGSPGGRSGTRR